MTFDPVVSHTNTDEYIATNVEFDHSRSLQNSCTMTTFSDLFGSNVLLHTPLFGPDRNLMAVRLDWHPLAGHERIDVLTMLGVLQGEFEEVLRACSVPLADPADVVSTLSCKLPIGTFVEFDAAWGNDGPTAQALMDLCGQGVRLISRGRPSSSSPIVSSVSMCIDTNGPQHVCRGVKSLQEADQAFERGAVATLGWPVCNALRPINVPGEADLKLVMDLIRRIDNGGAVEEIESLIDRSPTLSFRLMGFLNSAASGLRSEVTSLRQAIMMLGYAKLRHWVAFLLASAVETPATRPLMHAALRRGYFMRSLAGFQGLAETQSDLFICGVFSLLDQMLGKPMSELVSSLPLPSEVVDCLASDSGPFKPYLDLARAVESICKPDWNHLIEAAAVTASEMNQATLSSLNSASNTPLL